MYQMRQWIAAAEAELNREFALERLLDLTAASGPNAEPGPEDAEPGLAAEPFPNAQLRPSAEPFPNAQLRPSAEPFPNAQPRPSAAPVPTHHALAWEQARSRARDSAGQPLPLVTRDLDVALGHALAGPLTALTALTAPTDVPPAGSVPAPPRRQEGRTGEVLLPAGTVVTPVVLGLAAAAGHDRLAVHRRPRVELLLLGEELPPSGPARAHRAPDVIGPLLPPWLTRHGAEVIGRRRVQDDTARLRDALRDSTADVVVAAGGTAAGPMDPLRTALGGSGARLLVDSVAVRPGHPMLLAELPPSPDGRPRFLVGLPGEPQASVAGAVTLAVPLLRRLGGHADPQPYRMYAAVDLPGHPHDTRLLPVRRAPHGVAPLVCDGPAKLLGLAVADGLAVVPPGGAPAGTGVEVLEVPGP
ncbi:molybdopterin-binding protein [Streptomyces stackebrandtii]|uniref:molybdopterin-binding protein n=1 Tax=Streptomyces stackebrandtii TaxID=3051177 RepID=UPI0028DB6036|nr:molybdopterin-binding protein [Streptomyces sp. DSM 40976]